MPSTFESTSLPGVVLIVPKVFGDARGFLMETYKRSEFEAAGLPVALVQENHSRSSRGTLRGLHYQAEPHAQPKLVRCTQGVIWDVIADLRAGSPSERRWIAVELSAANRRQLYVPSGCAHGYITLVDESEVLYQLATPWAPQAERGVRWDDPTLAIRWPLAPVVVSARDAALPRLG